MGFFVGIIKSVLTEEGQVVAVVMTGSGRAVTAQVMQAGPIDFFPCVGDRALCFELGEEIVVSAVFAEDSSTGIGEARIFGRNAAGVVVSTIHLKETGQIVLTPATSVSVGAGVSAVALSTNVEALWTCLLTALKGWTGTKPPDGGVGLAAALTAAFATAGLDPPVVGSTNLKAD